MIDVDLASISANCCLFMALIDFDWARVVLIYFDWARVALIDFDWARVVLIDWH